jgi:hypothetical protein
MPFFGINFHGYFVVICYLADFIDEMHEHIHLFIWLLCLFGIAKKERVREALIEKGQREFIKLV